MEFRQLLPEPASVEVDVLMASLAPGERAREDRPHTAVNFVTSADGRATFGGRSGPLGDDGDRAMFHGLREQFDAVMSGTRTLRTERYGRILGKPERRQRRLDQGQLRSRWPASSPAAAGCRTTSRCSPSPRPGWSCSAHRDRRPGLGRPGRGDPDRSRRADADPLFLYLPSFLSWRSLVWGWFQPLPPPCWRGGRSITFSLPLKPGGGGRGQNKPRGPRPPRPGRVKLLW